MQKRNLTNKLRQLREARGFKQVELASRAGVPVPIVNRTENWHLAVSRSTAQRLADALGCAVEDVFPYLTDTAEKVEVPA